jgi:hypothetical protein
MIMFPINHRVLLDERRDREFEGSMPFIRECYQIVVSLEDGSATIHLVEVSESIQAPPMRILRSIEGFYLGDKNLSVQGRRQNHLWQRTRFLESTLHPPRRNPPHAAR